MWVSSAIGTGPGLDELGERLAGSDRRELVGVADEHDVRLRADGAQERDEQLEVGHRGLVDDQEVGVELLDRRALAGDPAEGGVDGRGVEAAGLGHPAGGSAGGGDEQDRGLLLRRGRADQPDRRGLARARAAGDDREAGGERGADRGGLLGRWDEVVGGWGARCLQARRRRGQVGDDLGEVALELCGLGAVGPDRLWRGGAIRVGLVELDDERARVGHLAEARGVRRGAEQLAGSRGELGDRQAGRAGALRLAQDVEHARACSRG